VLAVTGPHDTEGVMRAVHAHLPRPHDPFTDLVPPQGIKLTPKHYAYLKISEGCNHRCTFCIIPSMRGDLVSRPIGEVMQEAENLVRAGVRELLVISQDTSAYGVDVKYRTGLREWPSAEDADDRAVPRARRARRCGCACTTYIPIRTSMK
jgi:ribosomal protein S12 methylthiotransferase